MTVWLDIKYINLVGSRLRNFKRKSDHLFSFSCPLCGDSKKDKSKARGYIYKKKEAMFFHCHNCQEGMFFGKLLKRLDLNLHQQYSLEQFADLPTKPKISAEEEAKPFITSPVFYSKEKINLPSIESLPFNHFAKKYIISRKLPKQFLSDIYYSSCFKSFLDEMLPGNEKNIPLMEKRVIIPFYDERQHLLGFQGRALFESKLKYITIMMDETKRKVFGLNKVDLTKPILVVEGPFDSMFLYNAVATMDSGLYRAAEVMGQDNDYIFVYDNEKRNSQIISNMEKTIKLGHKIFIWPRSVGEKDINEMVMSTWEPDQVMDMIMKHNYMGMEAELRMTMWRK